MFQLKDGIRPIIYSSMEYIILSFYFNKSITAFGSYLIFFFLNPVTEQHHPHLKLPIYHHLFVLRC